MWIAGWAPEDLSHLSRSPGHTEDAAGEFGGDAMPKARAAQHGVIAVTYLDGRHVSQRTSALRVGPGVLGTRDAVGVPVHQQDPPSSQLPDRFPGRQPRSQARDRGNSRMPGGAQSGTCSHRVPDQDDMDRTEPAAEAIQDAREIIHRLSPVAIPSAQLE